jgi:hypothetical protein
MRKNPSSLFPLKDIPLQMQTTRCGSNNIYFWSSLYTVARKSNTRWWAIRTLDIAQNEH